MLSKLWGYIYINWLAHGFTLVSLFYLRKTWIEGADFYPNDSFYIGIGIVPVAWLFLYYLQGTYIEIKRIYRLRAITFTLSASIFGSLIIFFSLLLDDQVLEYTTYYESVSLLFLLHFCITFCLDWYLHLLS